MLALNDPSWFASQVTWVLLLITVVSMIALAKGADWLVEGAAGLAFRLGMPKIIVGATIVSLGTTSPEAAVSVMAAWQGKPELALGNAVGSIITDAGLIFGLGCMMCVLPADRFVLNRQGWVQFGAAVLLSVICYGAYLLLGDQAAITRPIGAIFLILLAGYIFLSIKWARQHGHGEPFMDPQVDPQKALKKSVVILSLLLVIGLAIVIVASQVMIGAVAVVAERWGVPQVVIAGTLVAFGTSAPELVVGITSIIKGHRELLVGNVIGADILNVLFVTGASALAKPLPIVDASAGATQPLVFLWLHLPAMLIILLVFRIFIRGATKRGNFLRWQGVPLVIIYVAFILLGYFTTGSVPH